MFDLLICFSRKKKKKKRSASEYEWSECAPWRVCKWNGRKFQILRDASMFMQFVYHILLLWLGRGKYELYTQVEQTQAKEIMISVVLRECVWQSEWVTESKMQYDGNDAK